MVARLDHVIILDTAAGMAENLIHTHLKKEKLKTSILKITKEIKRKNEIFYLQIKKIKKLIDT